MPNRLSRRHFLALGAAAAVLPVDDAEAQTLTFRGDESIASQGWYLPPSPYGFLGSPSDAAEAYIDARVTLGEADPVCPDETIPPATAPTADEYMAKRRCFRDSDRAGSTMMYMRQLGFFGDPVYRTDLDYDDLLGVWTGLTTGEAVDLSGATLLHTTTVDSSDDSVNMIRWWLDYPGQPTGSWVEITARQHATLPTAFWWQIRCCKYGVESLDGFNTFERVRKP